MRFNLTLFGLPVIGMSTEDPNGELKDAGKGIVATAKGAVNAVAQKVVEKTTEPTVPQFKSEEG